MAKPPKPFQSVIATANTLRTGDVVFRSGAGHWSHDVADAQLAETADAAAQLQAAADADNASCVIVDQALIAATREGGTVRPLALRERIRASGPTVAYPQDGALTGASPGAFLGTTQRG